MTLSSTFLEYNALDSACTLECHNTFWSDLSEGYEPAYKLTMDILPPLMQMQTRGIKISMEEMRKTKTEILQSAATKQEELNNLCGRMLNVNSPKEMQGYFYIELGIPPYYNDGAVTVDDLALQRLSRGTAKRAGLRQAKLVQEIRGLQKLHGTYLNIEFDSDQRLRCSYNPRGTKFGRLSSSKTVFGTGTNQQNLPQEFKRFLVADDGYCLVEIDKRQAEWVVVAYLTGDANMISVVEHGKDSHVHTASLMFGLEEDIILAENKLIGNNSDPDAIENARRQAGLERFLHKLPRTMSARQCGKKSNHGLNYDEGFVTFGLINEIEQAEAKRIIAMYHSIYPGIRQWYENIKRQLQKSRSLTNCFGRKVSFLDAWDQNLWKAAYSMLPQSSVVDCLNIGMCKVYNDDWLMGKLGLNMDLLAQVHDSILIQVPMQVMQDWQTFAKAQELIYDYVSPELQYNSRKFKIATDVKIGLNWGGASAGNPLGMRELKSPSDLPKELENMNVSGVK